jgi:hypothetical protein
VKRHEIRIFRRGEAGRFIYDSTRRGINSRGVLDHPGFTQYLIRRENAEDTSQLSLLCVKRVQGTLRGVLHIPQNMRIDHRRFNVLVAKEVLHFPDIDTSLQ